MDERLQRSLNNLQTAQDEVTDRVLQMRERFDELTRLHHIIDNEKAVDDELGLREEIRIRDLQIAARDSENQRLQARVRELETNRREGTDKTTQDYVDEIEQKIQSAGQVVRAFIKAMGPKS